MDSPDATEDATATALNTPPGGADDDVRALEALRQHHAGMLKRLGALAAALSGAVMAGNAVAEHDAHEVLVEWCETDLVPHALAEEGRLYEGAGRTPEARLLVTALVAEHQGIAGMIEQLRGSRGVDAAVAAGALRALVAMHLQTEDQILLPFLAGHPDLSLASAVEGLEELVGESHIHGGGADRGSSV
ncbi:hemerythrin domain-containing protein [Arthrobacter oryzae]|uniref:Hemerythrin HHE cation binding domain-containing protein n=1 Tax=Arthrobacter oryzae TaxID=409290 RepID=A0A495FNK0_9MICC|nr:hemerythrin domain-containing protein [Arthrobacter oryzae]RKR30311.1 hemerythrin HHE cation binding domain-containing protein [Arthrobacter oryzae]